MLTKRQLEDAAECLARFHERTCGQCSCNKFRYGYVGSYSCTENAAKTALAYRELLEEVIKHLSHCPFCKINRPWLYKHKDGCKLAALLKESGGEEG